MRSRAKLYLKFRFFFFKLGFKFLNAVTLESDKCNALLIASCSKVKISLPLAFILWPAASFWLIIHATKHWDQLRHLFWQLHSVWQHENLLLLALFFFYKRKEWSCPVRCSTRDSGAAKVVLSGSRQSMTIRFYRARYTIPLFFFLAYIYFSKSFPLAIHFFLRSNSFLRN